MALQALSLYSEHTAGKAFDLRVKLSSELDADWKPPEIHITPESALLRRQIDVRNKRAIDSTNISVGIFQNFHVFNGTAFSS